MFPVSPIFGEYLPGSNVYWFVHLWEMFALELETLFTALPTFGKYLKHCLLVCPSIGNICRETIFPALPTFGKYPLRN
jgi:hypothetical protein